MKNNKIIIFTLCLILLPLLYSQVETLKTVKLNDCISLPQSYYNSTYSNITKIMYPNKTEINVNYAMTRDSFGNYNYTYCNTSVLGQYIITTTTDVDGIPVNVQYDFSVTKTGYEINSSQITVTFFIVGLVFLIALLFFIFGMKTEIIGLKLFCISLTIILIAFLIGYIMNMADNFVGEYSFITESFSPLYIIFISLLTVGGIGLILYLIYMAFDKFHKYRGLKLQ